MNNAIHANGCKPASGRQDLAPRALVLDFGGVISRTLFETHALTEQALGLPPGTLRWQGPFAPQSDPLWRAMQAGEISERDYWRTRAREVGALLGEQWTTMEDFVRRARGADPDSVIRPQAQQLVQIARAAGVRLAVLSNELDLFYGKDFRHRVQLLDSFEVIVDASHTQVLKPAPLAYAMVCDALQLPAAQCVFIDDQPRNVEGAKKAGMIAIELDVRNPHCAYAQALELFGLQLPASNQEPRGDPDE